MEKEKNRQILTRNFAQKPGDLSCRECKDEDDGENWDDVFLSTDEGESAFLKGECKS